MLAPDNIRTTGTTICITGATGAIGGALALEYAAPGRTLILHGRNRQKLEQLAADCQARGATVALHSFDLCDRTALLSWIEQLVTTQLPDLLIANAGMNINHGPDNCGEDWQAQQQLLELNVNATLLLTNRIALVMRQRQHGQIVLVSSLASYFGLPVTPSYSASKAAVKAYGEGMRGWLARNNVGVTVVMPGYVRSSMCHQMPGPKPFLISPEKAARRIRHGVERNRARVSFPFPLNFGTWWLAVLPAALSQRILALLNYDA